MSSCGFDCGTYNLVCCQRDENGDFIQKREVNAFLEMPLDNKFVFNMMKSAGVPLIELEEHNKAFACGEAAVNMAYTMTGVELRRPMKDGCLNPKEKAAQEIMSMLMHGMLDGVKHDKTVLYYSVPAEAINEETDAVYHGKVLEAVFRDFESDEGFIVDPHPINEGLALVYAELGSKMWTGMGLSFGAGMVNVCFAITGYPIFTFALVNSGDWIDKQSARATGETPAFINKEKTKVDLMEDSPELVQRAIKAQYEIMMSKTISGIKKGLEEAGNKARTDHPIDVIISGGTSSPKGFDVKFREMMLAAELPIDIADVKRPSDPLYSVARGCLIAAEAHSQG